jgi:ADP-ribose pyrophosphatase
MTVKPPGAAIISATPLTTGFLKVSRYQFRTDTHAGGEQIIEREVMERGHAVGVLGYDRVRDTIVLINEFRPGCLLAGDQCFTDNVVAGGIAQNESALDAAVREMKEETGLTLTSPVLVHPGAYVSSGGTSEKIAIVVGIVDSSQAGGIHGNANESEDILTVVMLADHFITRVHSGEISDLKTLVAGYWFAMHRDRLRSGGL